MNTGFQHFQGHLGLKSNAFSPTGCKLTTQYLVMDHMNAHYKKLNKARACVDNSQPEAWLVSQKIRDQKRRANLKKELVRKAKGMPTKQKPRSFPNSLTNFEEAKHKRMRDINTPEDDYDHLDAGSPFTHTTLAVHASDTDADVRRLGRNQQYRDSSMKYRESDWQYETGAKPGDNRSNRNTTPRSGDLLDTHLDKFTEEKPFQPRTLKSNRVSKLSTFKYYNPPKKSSEAAGFNSSRKIHHRPETPMTESVDWMNETLVSRDMNLKPTPSEVPPLDISLDADHMQWVKEQANKVHLRKTYPALSEGGSDAWSTGFRETEDNPVAPRESYTSFADSRDEEMKYLEFITDVTNDVLDRGIFTNRILKHVFESHIHKRKHELKISKMRDMLEELRQDLGVPLAEEDSDGLGMSTTSFSATYETKRFSSDLNNGRAFSGGDTGTHILNNSRSSRLTTQHDTKPKRNLPILKRPERGSGRATSPDGKPPIPRTGLRSSGGRTGTFSSWAQPGQNPQGCIPEHGILASSDANSDALKHNQYEKSFEKIPPEKMDDEDQLQAYAATLEAQNTVDEEMELESAGHSSRRSREPHTGYGLNDTSSGKDSWETPRSAEQTPTSESIDVSELDDFDGAL